MKALIAFQLLLCFFLTGKSLSQPLELTEALRMVEERNLQLRKQTESEKIARLQEWVQKAKRLPSLDLSVSSSYLTEVNEIDLSRTIGIPDRRVELGGHDRSEIILGIRQPIFTGFRLKSQIELAKNTTLSEHALFETLANEIHHKVHLIFYSSQSLTNQRRILESSRQRLQVQLRQVRNLFEAAQVMAFDTLRVFNQMLALDIDLEKNAFQRGLIKLQLAHLLDLPEARPIAEIGLDAPTDEWPDVIRLKQQALAQRPELQRLQLAQKGARIQENLARSTLFPVVFGHANFHYAKPGLDPVVNEWMDYFSVGFNLQWNLWRWQGDRKQVESIRIRRNQLTLEEQALLRAIEIEVEERFEELLHRVRQWRLARQLQKQQSERYRIVSAQHQNGLATTNDLVTAEADLTNAELRTQNVVIRYHIGVADLKKATGAIMRNGE